MPCCTGCQKSFQSSQKQIWNPGGLYKWADYVSFLHCVCSGGEVDARLGFECWRRAQLWRVQTSLQSRRRALNLFLGLWGVKARRFKKKYFTKWWGKLSIAKYNNIYCKLITINASNVTNTSALYLPFNRIYYQITLLFHV